MDLKYWASELFGQQSFVLFFFNSWIELIFILKLLRYDLGF